MTGNETRREIGPYERGDDKVTGRTSALLLAGCGELALGPASPLAGTWYGAGRYPGRNAFTGKIVFDYSGNMMELDVESYQDRITLRFDGQPHTDADDNVYVARAQTDNRRQEIRSQRSCGVHRRQVRRRDLHHGCGQRTVWKMDGTIAIDFPDGESVLFYLDATRR